MSPNWLARYRQRRQQYRRTFTTKVAHRLYENRLARGKVGDAATDWARAEKIVRRPWNRVLFRAGFAWRRRVEAFERSLFEAALEGLVNDLSNLAIIDLLGVLASLSLISGAVGYFLEADERRKQTHYQAWEVINSAVGREAESGRRAAIEDLWADGVSLIGLDIHNATILNLDLSYHCYFFSKVRLPTFICDVPAFRSWRDGVNAAVANLESSYLEGAKLDMVYLWSANLKGAFIGFSSLTDIDLEAANLEEAVIAYSNLEKANFTSANLERTLLLKTNLQNVRGLTESQLSDSLICRVRLPENISIDPDRNCDVGKRWIRENRGEFYEAELEQEILRNKQ